MYSHELVNRKIKNTLKSSFRTVKNRKINKTHKEFKEKHFFSPFPARGAENTEQISKEKTSVKHFIPVQQQRAQDFIFFSCSSRKNKSWD